MPPRSLSKVAGDGTRRELLSPRAREAVRDMMSSTTLHEIDTLWQDELFPPVLEDPSPVGGQRVTRFQGYLNQVDWTDHAQVTRAMRVFEAALAWAFVPDSEFTPSTESMKRLRRLFARDGYTWTPGGEIVAGQHVVVSEALLSNLTDPQVIRDHLDRIERAVSQDDPAQAIGSAKELIESTAKIVLRQLGVEIPSGDQVPELVRRAQLALAIHPSTTAAGPDGSNAVKKILGASTTIAIGVAELRNAGYGTGHGPIATRSGLGPRHARLAVNAARLWCEFILDTLADERAPWRTARPGDGRGDQD